MCKELKTIDRKIEEDFLNNYWDIRTLFNNARQKKHRLREKIISLQKGIMTYKEKIYELKEALVREQNKNASFETDLIRSRRELRELLSPFIIAGKRSAKFLNSIVFI